MTTWPRSAIEQDLRVTEKEEIVNRLEHASQSIVVHGYTAPSRAAWERAYAEEYGGTPPIPPGMKLCWYDMRNGIMRQHMTTFDTSGGVSSSGEVYRAIRNQNKAPIRYLGRLSIDGYIKNPVNNNPTIRLGVNQALERERGLLMIEIYFRIRHRIVDDTVRLLVDFGDDVLEPEMTIAPDVNTLSTSAYMEPDDTFSSATDPDASFTRLKTMITMVEGADPAGDGALNQPPMIGWLRIYNPFGFRKQNASDEQFRYGNSVVRGLIFHYKNAFGTNMGMQDRGVVAHHLNTHRVHPVPYGRDWRPWLFQTVTGGTYTAPVSGAGWAYGYYTSDVSSLEAYAE